MTTRNRVWVRSVWFVAVLGFVDAAPGADYTWLASPASANWNTTDANWSGAGSIWANGATNNAFFGASDTESIAAAAVTLSNLTFNADGYVISGGPLMMYGNPTVHAGYKATLDASVTNANYAWTKYGLGTLVLNPGAGVSNVFYALKASTGTVHIVGGTSVVTQVGSNPESGPAFWVSGGTLVMGGGLLKSTGNMYGRVSEYGTLLITNGVVDLTNYAELLNGHNSPGVTTVSGSGVLDLQVLRVSQNQTAPASATAVNINTGGVIRLVRFGLDTSTWRYGTINFNGGTVVARDTLNQQDLLGSTSTNWRHIAVNVLPGGATFDNNGCNFTIRRPLNGTPGDGGLTKRGAGIMYLRATNTYNGGTALWAGTLNITVDDNLGAVPASPATNVRFLGNSTLQSSGDHALAAGRTLWISNAVTASFDPQSYKQTIYGTIMCADTGSTFNKTGSGMVVLDRGAGGLNTFGTLQTSAGTLVIASGTNLVTRYCNVQNGPGLRVNGGTMLVAGGVVMTTTGKYVNVDGGHLLVTNGLVNTLSCDQILNSIGGNGTGRTTVSGSGAIWANQVRISQNIGNPSNSVINVSTGGVLRLKNFYIDINANQRGIVFLDGGTLEARESNDNFFGSTATLVGNNNDRWLTNIFVYVCAGGAKVDTAGFTIGIKQPLQSGADVDGGLVKVGAGTLTLYNTNTYNGATAVMNGRLRLGRNNALNPAGNAFVGNGAVLDLGGFAQSLAGLGGSGTVSNGALTVTVGIAPGSLGGIGTLTLALTPVALGGTLLADVAADGSCDRLDVRGNLDVSNLALQLADPEQLDKTRVYTLATCTGVLSGAFASNNVPSRWLIRYDAAVGRVYLVYNFGTLITVL